MNKPKAVVFDLDDCTMDFRGLVVSIHEALTGIKYTARDLKEWDFPEDLYKTFKDHEDYIYRAMRPKPNAVDKIIEFRSRGYEVVFMTARPEKFKDATEFSLKMAGIWYDDLLFNKNKSLKINRISDKYEIRVFADDKLATVEKVKRDTDVPHVYLVEAPWNKNEEVSEGVKRIKSINEIR